MPPNRVSAVKMRDMSDRPRLADASGSAGLVSWFRLYFGDSYLAIPFPSGAGSDKKARGTAKLFQLFDDEHFNGHIRRNKVKAELVSERPPI